MCLPYTVFPERIQTPVTYRRLLCALQSSIPRPPAVSIASFDKESHREANPSPTPSSEWEETPLIFTVRQEMNMGARGSPRQAWGSSFLEQEMTKMPIQVHSVNPVHLEAIGTHINRHLRFQSQPPCNSKGDSVPSGEYHFVVPNSFFLFSVGHISFLTSIEAAKLFDPTVSPILEHAIRTVVVSL